MGARFGPLMALLGPPGLFAFALLLGTSGHQARRPASAPDDQLEKVPSRSLKRSSRPGERTSGGAEAKFTRDVGFAHNSCTAGEIGWARSPAWNSVRNIGSRCGSDAVFNSVLVVALIGVTVRASGMVERKLAFSIVAEGAVTPATAVGRGVPPSAAKAVRLSLALAAAA